MNPILEKYFNGIDTMVQMCWDPSRPSLARKAAVATVSNYPPFNIKKTDEGKYQIEMAVAGFGKQDLSIDLVDGTLVIQGNASSGDEASDSGFFPLYYHKGLAKRAFTRTFGLSDRVEIKNAELINGILRIAFDAVVPEEKKAVKIEINEVE